MSAAIEEQFPLWISAQASYACSARADYADRYAGSGVAVVVDQGSHSTRVGWAGEQQPSAVYRTVVARPRLPVAASDETGGEHSGTRSSYVGGLPDGVSAGMFSFRSPMERDMVYHQASQEQLLDYAFASLGIDTPGCVEHPLVINEAVCNPNYARGLVTELAFECYALPSLCLGLAPLWAFHHHQHEQQQQVPTGVVVSIGHHDTHVLAVIDGRFDAANVRRIGVGGATITAYLTSLLELKYPQHRSSLTPARLSYVKERHCYSAVDYPLEAALYARHADKNTTNSEEDDDAQLRTVVLQLPPPQTTDSNDDDGDNDDNDDDDNDNDDDDDDDAQQQRQQQLQRRRQALRQQRQDLPQQLRDELASLQRLLVNSASMSAGQLASALRRNDLADLDELHAIIERLTKRLSRLEQSSADADSAKEDATAKPIVSEALRRAHAAIQRKKLERQLERQRVEAAQAEEERRRQADPRGYLQELLARRDALVQRQTQRLSARRSRREAASRSAGGGGDEEEAALAALQRRIAEVEEQDAPELYRQRQRAQHQIVMDVECIRCPELLQQPHFVGLDEMGLNETLHQLLASYPRPVAVALARNVFLTGASAQFRQLAARVQRPLQAVMPLGTVANVYVSASPATDAWRGASLFAADSDALADASITRQMYLEHGPAYLRPHPFSNVYIPTPPKPAGYTPKTRKRQRK